MGYVYFIRDEFSRLVKIGKTGDLKRRIAFLQTGAPSPLTLLGASERLDESELHTRFEESRVRGEWFRLTPALQDVVLACEVDLDALLGRKLGSHPIMQAKGDLILSDVAKRATCSVGYLRQVTSGHRRPSFEVAERIADVLTNNIAARDSLVLAIMRHPYRVAL